MAKASVDLVCSNCGKPFTHSRILRNTTAASSYEKWAKENVTLCRDCNRDAKAVHRQAVVDDILKEYAFELPEISGASDKQIAFAQTLRYSYLYNHLDETKKHCKATIQMRDQRDMLEQARKARGMTAEDAWKEL